MTHRSTQLDNIAGSEFRATYLAFSKRVQTLSIKHLSTNMSLFNLGGYAGEAAASTGGNAEAGPSRPKPTIPTPAELPSGFMKWRSGLAQFTGLGLSDEEKQAREEMKANDTLAKDWDRCEKYKRDLLKDSTSSSISFISDDFD